MAETEPTRSFAAARDLVSSPRETLAHELKEWLDPGRDEDKANLVRAILAMRNHEFGGLIAIGISDDGKHQKAPRFNVDSAYAQEAIQAIVSNYASRSFEVEVHRIELNGVRYPVIAVPGAGDMPVVCKSAIGRGQKPHLRESVILVRTLDKNGIPSSAPASWKDVERIFETCFRNREANYAEFFSRILRATDPSEVRSLVTKAKEVSVQALEAFEGVAAFRSYSLQRFQEAVTEDNFNVERLGFLDVVLMIDGRSERKWQNDNTFLTALISAYPNLFKARAWKIRLSSSETRFRPYPFDSTYEQRTFKRPSGHIVGQGIAEFIILDPAGRFFLRSGCVVDLLKDAQQHRGVFLDPVPEIVSLAHAFVVGSSYAKALRYEVETQLHFGIYWTGLKGRKFEDRISRKYDFWWAKECHQDSVELEITLPLEPSNQEVIQKTTQAIQKLARAFDVAMSEQIIAKEVQQHLHLM